MNVKIAAVNVKIKKPSLLAHPEAWWKMCKSAVSAWADDYAPSMGAALAYYTVFSIAPLLLIVISVAGLIFGPDAARGAIFDELRTLIGVQGAQAVEAMLSSVNKPAENTFATLLGLVVLLVGATTVFAELQDSLDRIWRVPRENKPSGVFALVRTRLLSFGMILGIGFLLIVSLVASAVLAIIEEWWRPWFGDWMYVAQVVNFLLSFTLITTVFAMIYKIMPRVRISWGDVWLGAIVTSLLFTVGKALIGLYIAKSGVASGYGAAGSLIVLLLWVYYSAQIFFLGAEFTWIYAHTFGSFRHKKGQRSFILPTKHWDEPEPADEASRPIWHAPTVSPLPGSLGGMEHRGQTLQPPLAG